VTLRIAVFTICTAYGLVIFYLIIGFGLFRASSDAALVFGTWLAASSGGFWYFAAIVPPIWPTRVVFAAALNAGAAAFLVPGDKLSLVRNAFGLG
jgi:hypothetical protein